MWPRLGLAVAVAVPAVALHLSGTQVVPEAAVVIFGAAVVASAFLLAWAAEAAQVDISSSLAIAILALIAVLPEYAVDLYFAFTAGHEPQYTQFAAANMTGSNRLLIGIGWPLVAVVSYLAGRRRSRPSDMEGRLGPDSAPTVAVEELAGGPRAAGRFRGPIAVELPVYRRVELFFLLVASLYAFVIPLTRSIAWYDAVVLLTLFVLYLWRVTREGRGEPELIGVAAEIAALPRLRRRALVAALFTAAGIIVVSSAAPFANGLVGTGSQLGIDQFLLVQWLAPLSSEAPEMIVATLFALHLRGDDGLGTLLSAKVNQWTLLVGSLAVAYWLGGGGTALPLDNRQTEEFVLTAAQALLGVAVLLDLRLGLWEAGALFLLFALQFPFPQTDVRLAFSAAYLVFAAALMLRRRSEFPEIVRTTLRRRGPGGEE